MKLAAIALVAVSMLTLVASAEPDDQAPDQFWRATVATSVDTNRLLAMHLLGNAAQYCCKTCTTGKACGDTCISRDKECRVGPGCACDD